MSSINVNRSVYEERLELLVCGYTKHHSNGLFIPFDLLNAIIHWHSKQPKLIVSMLNNDLEFLLEFYLDQPSNKLLNIAKYILSYTDMNNNKNSKQKMIQHFENNYFVGFATIDIFIIGCRDVVVEVTAVDEHDKELIKSEKLAINCAIGPLTLLDEVNFDIIDINHNGYLNLDEFILAMKTLNIGFNELLYIRIFCYMNFRENCHENSN
eukprot:466124_1